MKFTHRFPAINWESFSLILHDKNTPLVSAVFFFKIYGFKFKPVKKLRIFPWNVKAHLVNVEIFFFCFKYRIRQSYITFSSQVHVHVNFPDGGLTSSTFKSYFYLYNTSNCRTKMFLSANDVPLNRTKKFSVNLSEESWLFFLENLFKCTEYL